MNACEVCGKPATVIGCEDYKEGDEEKIVPVHFFCQEHYENWRNNEIELPAERLETLNWRNDA